MPIAQATNLNVPNNLHNFLQYTNCKSWKPVLLDLHYTTGSYGGPQFNQRNFTEQPKVDIYSIGPNEYGCCGFSCFGAVSRVNIRPLDILFIC